MTGSRDPKTAIPLSVDMAMSALKTAAAAGLKRFVYTSSSFAVTQPKPGVRFTVDEGTFNEEAVRKVEELGERAGGATVYAASKVEVERAMGKWVREEGVGIVVNCGGYFPLSCFPHHLNISIRGERDTDNSKSTPTPTSAPSSLPPTKATLQPPVG
jgi:hypothetical protein